MPKNIEPITLTAADFLPFARNGAEVLNQEQPGWRSLITGPLHMGECSRCVLGQVYGHYSTGMMSLPKQVFYHPDQYGFGIENGAHRDSFYLYIALGQAWQLILEGKA